jgi:AraC-like DNA-binding protein
MKSLDAITDWPKRAREAGYNWKRLARDCGISPRTLHVYFQTTFHYPPQEWLNRLRLFDAMALMWKGVPVKKAALVLGFKRVTFLPRVQEIYRGDTDEIYRGLPDQVESTGAGN